MKLNDFCLARGKCHKKITEQCIYEFEKFTLKIALSFVNTKKKMLIKNKNKNKIKQKDITLVANILYGIAFKLISIAL